MMSDSIPLHKEKGLNPHMVKCVYCGEIESIALVGARDKKFRCATCNIVYVGTSKCPQCGTRGEYEGTLEDGEYLSGVCEKCKRDLEHEDVLFKEEIKKGGVYFRCIGCGASGVIIAEHPIAINARKKLGIEAPDPCGAELPNCPNCPERK